MSKITNEMWGKILKQLAKLRVDALQALGLNWILQGFITANALLSCECG